MCTRNNSIMFDKIKKPPQPANKHALHARDWRRQAAQPVPPRTKEPSRADPAPATQVNTTTGLARRARVRY